MVILMKVKMERMSRLLSSVATVVLAKRRITVVNADNGWVIVRSQPDSAKVVALVQTKINAVGVATGWQTTKLQPIYVITVVLAQRRITVVNADNGLHDFIAFIVRIFRHFCLTN